MGGTSLEKHSEKQYFILEFQTTFESTQEGRQQKSAYKGMVKQGKYPL